MLWALWKDVKAALTPSAYRALSLRPAGRALRFFACLLLLGGLAMVVGIFVRLPSISEELAADLGTFSTLALNGTAAQDAPALILDHPRVAVDFSKNLTNEFILINNQTVQVRLLPLMPAQQVFWADVANVLAHRDALAALIAVLIVVLLPSIYVAAVLAFMVKYAVLLCLLSLVVWLAFRWTAKGAPYRELWVGGLHAFALLGAVELALLPWTRPPWWPWVAGFVLQLILGLAIRKPPAATPPKRHRRKSPPPFLDKEDNFIQPRETLEQAQ